MTAQPIIPPGVSDAELQRRWSAVQEMMQAKNLDYLLIRNCEPCLGGYLRWFIDFPAVNGYSATLIFPRNGEMSLIVHGAMAPADPGPPPWAVRGVKNRLGAPYFSTMHFTYDYDGELAVGALKEKKDAKIGLVGKAFFPLSFTEYLQKHLPGLSFVDVVEQIDMIKVIKSPEEIELIKATALMQDEVIQVVKDSIKPGMKEYELYAEAWHACYQRGSTAGLILIGSGPADTAVPFKPRHFQNRTIEDGDQISVLIEVNGVGGMYTEIARVYSLGQPCQRLQEAIGVAKEAQDQTLGNLVTGASPKDIWEASNAFVSARGYSPDRRLYAHGQGYDLVERPAIRFDEPMAICPGLNLAVHPAAANDKVWAAFCDNYMTTENGASECLHKTPKEIIVI